MANKPMGPYYDDSDFVYGSDGLSLNVKVKLDSTGAPTVSNDTSEGYTVGSRWINVTADKEYVCLDSSSGAAIWEETTNDELAQWAGAVTLSTGGAINLVTFSTGGTVNVPSGEEYQINGSEVKLDEWGTPTDVTTLNSTTGLHGLLPKGDADTTHYLAGDISWTSTTGIVLDSLTTPTTGTALNATTGRHGLLITLDGSTGNFLRGDGSWQTAPGAAGEANTASNVSTTGVGVYESKVGVDLQFKGIHSTGDISVTDTTGTHTINLNVISTGIKLDDLGTPDNNTDLDASTGVHGLLLKRTGSTVTYLRADGTWATPTGTTGGAAMTFLDLTDTPADYTDDANKFLSVSTGEDAVEFVTPKADEIEISEIGTATYDDIQDWLNNTQSGGIVAGVTISDDTDGTITVSSGQGYIKTTTGDIGLIKSFDIAADSSTGIDLADNSINYVYVDYNAGSPKFAVTDDRTTIHTSDQFDVGRIYRVGTTLHIINSGNRLANLGRIEHERLLTVRGFERASGGVISESAVTERALTSTIGKFYLGQNKITTEAQDTSTGDTDTFTYWYYDGANWQSTTGQTIIDNTNYNDTSTGLTALGVNRYGVHWGYVHFDSDIHVVYGQGNYTLAQAEIAVVPDSLPSMVEDFGILASKIIIQKESTGFNSIVTAYKALFPVTNPAEHNDLGALDTNDYQHLTQAEHDEITKWAGAVTLSTGGTIDIPTGQEYQINSAKVKLDDWNTPTDVTTLNATTGLHGLLPKRDGNSAHWLDGSGAWTAPTAAEVGAVDISGTPVANDIPRFTDANTIEGLSYAELKAALDLEIGTDILAQQTIGIANDNLLEVDDADAADNDYAKFTTGGLEGRNYSEVKTDLSLNLVENTALSTWAGTTGITILGTIGTGTWNATAIADGKIASAATWNAKIANTVEDTSPELGGDLDAQTHHIGFTQQTVTYNVTTTTVDWGAGNKATVTLTGNIGTMAFTNPAKPSNLLLKIVQDATGSRTITTWDADIKWVDGTAPTLTTTGNGIDICSFYWDSTNYFGMASLAFS